MVFILKMLEEQKIIESLRSLGLKLDKKDFRVNPVLLTAYKKWQDVLIQKVINMDSKEDQENFYIRLPLDFKAAIKNA